MGKALIRKQLLNLRRQLDSSTHLRLSQQVQQQLLGSECFIRAKALALYSPINNEVATEHIFSAAKRLNKKIYYPRVRGDELEFFEVLTATELLPESFGVTEPIAGKTNSVSELDLVIVPGVTFDLKGHRLGYGRGFYDRQLTGKLTGTVSVGLGFKNSVFDLSPTEDHDQALDFVAT